MNVGKLNKIVEIYQPNLTQNNLGENITDFIKIAQRRCELMNLKISEKEANDRLNNITQYKIRMRDDIVLVADYRFKINTQFFDIINIEPSLNRRREQFVTVVKSEV